MVTPPPRTTKSTLETFVKQARRSTAASKPLLLVGNAAGNAKAAAAIAADLKRELMRIDVSALVSTYIGETEKTLDRVFASAAQSNAVLFFDEADALFGKRTDVKDSHDRYANVEVASLLQRIETYGGVAILATHRKPALDETVMRRFGTVYVDPPP